MGHWGTCPSSFGNSVHYTAADSLTVKISKITKEKTVLQFHLSRQKHAKTHVNRLKQSQHLKEIPGRGGEEKFILCSPSPHFLATPLQIHVQKYDLHQFYTQCCTAYDRRISPEEKTFQNGEVIKSGK